MSQHTNGGSLQPPIGYRDVELVGTGATSRVYRAIATDTGAPRALKRLNRHLVRSQDALARLRRELELLRALRHPGVVAVYDVISWSGDPTLVMDFVDGADLEAVVAESGKLPAREVERIARALFDILATTHAAGIVHRDIKPQNVRIGLDGRVFLLDFGSARLDAASQLTATGTTVGTPDYMAPELFAGSAYDPRVDVYGVGATLYEALTGAPPQSADSLAALTWLRQSEDVPPVYLKAPDTPAGLAQVVDRCLMRAPGARYASAGHALWALDHAEAERAFALHRSRFPPCLHCGAPVPPSLAGCPACGRESAFEFAPGVHHVEVAGLAQAGPFIRWITGRVPELVEDKERLFDWCAALSTGGRRYLSFVSEEDAAAEVARLSSLGVSARSQPQRPVSAMLVLGVVGIALATGAGVGSAAVTGVVCAALGAAVLLWALLAWATQRWSLLGAGRIGAWVGGVEMGAMLAVLAAWVVPKPKLPAGPAFAWLVFDPSNTLAVIGLTGAVVCVGATFALATLRGSRLGARRSPQPGVEGALPLLGRRTEPAGRATSVARSLVMATLVALLVVVEILATGAMVGPFFHSRPEVQAPGTWVANMQNNPWDARPAHALRATGGDWEEEWSTAGEERRWLNEQKLLQEAAAATQPPAPTPVATTPAPPSPYWAWAPLSPLLLFGGLGLRAWRRRRRVAREARALQGEVGEVWGPSPPDARAGGSTEKVAASGDGFVRAAVARTRRLEGYISGDQMNRAAVGLDGVTSSGLHDDSLLAQCVLETDDEQLARFRFLALEGELEAEAAESWWEAQS
jgi:tRNA A-37 threonylcarbamoyl transferase component Bud32